MCQGAHVQQWAKLPTLAECMMFYYATKRSAKVSCRHVDPSAKRTVGVVTKVDLAEPGIKDRLEATGADHLRLELGYVAVWDLN